MVSYVYGLGDLLRDVVLKIVGLIVCSGVFIMINVFGYYNFLLVVLLCGEGVNVFSGSDNICDFWWFFGDGDMLCWVEIIVYCFGFFIDGEFVFVFDVVMVGGVKVLRFEDYGVKVGVKVDFVVLLVVYVLEVVVGVLKLCCVFKVGCFVVENGVVIC